VIADLPLHKTLLRAADELGFKEATEVQAQAIPAALAGKDLIVSAKTGSGKTAAFLLPMLNRLLANKVRDASTLALILLPTRELALQTQKTFQTLARYTPIKCGLIMGGEAFKHQVATLRKNPEVIIATPGRLVDHIEKGTSDFRDLQVLVLDEADRMLEMGFAVEMETIARACKSERQTLMFSATLEHKGMSGIKRLLRAPESIVIDSHRQGHDSISQHIVLADDIKHKEKLVVALLAEEQAPRALVFCNTRKQCQELGNVLKYNKLRVDFLHGEIPQSDRKQVMNRFRSGQIEVLVATDVAARGLDVEGIELVINFNVAQSGDDHVHRIGRTGRAGQEGKAVTLVSSNEWNQMSSIERYLKIRFERRKVQGLIATYRGPKKVKNSGKAAGSKKKKKPATGNPKKKTGGETGYKPMKR
jgi:ATP-dependent RNA helicase SrmB